MNLLRILPIAACLTSSLLSAVAQTAYTEPSNISTGHESHEMLSPSTSRAAKKILRETDPQFFATPEARRIGEQVLLWQRTTGGWPKNINMVSPMTQAEVQEVLADKDRIDDSTTDNDATTIQIAYLARLYKVGGDERYKNAVIKGINYLLSGQYDNGGWPQFWPEMRDYQIHITYNDDAMVSTMALLRDIAMQKAPFDSDLCDNALRQRLMEAFDKGVKCILATQIVVDGTPTVWCQQHDRETFAPAKARSYELPSFCSQESAAIVQLLMEIPDPSPEVINAVNNAMAWFEKTRLKNRSFKRVDVDGKSMAMLFENPADDTPVWARYYDLENCRPFVCGRDGIPHDNLDEIEEERRNGYSWYNDRPALLLPIYEDWKARFK